MNRTIGRAKNLEGKGFWVFLIFVVFLIWGKKYHDAFLSSDFVQKPTKKGKTKLQVY